VTQRFEFVVRDGPRTAQEIFARGRALRGSVERAFRAIGAEFVGRAQGRIDGEWNPALNKRRTTLVNRSGALRRRGLRVQTVGGQRLRDVALRVYITLPYGVTQEFGGTIRPKRAKYLTIPTPAALDPSGILKKTAREYRAEGGTFVFNTPKRREKGLGGLIARRVGKKGKLEVLFVLAKQVNVPARWGLRKDWRSSDMLKVRGQEMTSAIRRVLNAQGAA